MTTERIQNFQILAMLRDATGCNWMQLDGAFCMSGYISYGSSYSGQIGPGSHLAGYRPAVSSATRHSSSRRHPPSTRKVSSNKKPSYFFDI